MTDTRTRIAVVTGAGSGIGRAVAVELLRAGWSVALAGRRTEPLEETAALVPEGAGLAVRTDVARPEEVAALFAATVDRFGRVDLLFNTGRLRAPRGARGGAAVRRLAAGGGHQPQRGVPVRAGCLPADEGAGPSPTAAGSLWTGGRTGSPSGRSTSATRPPT